VVVEHDLLDLRIERDRLELAEPAGVDGLDDDQAPDRVDLEAAGLYDRQLVGVQAVKLADVAVERAGEADDRVRIEPLGGQRGREAVEIGVAVRDDDGL
jgi:hypothetical protein